MNSSDTCRLRELSLGLIKQAHEIISILDKDESKQSTPNNSLNNKQPSKSFKFKWVKIDSKDKTCQYLRISTDSINWYPIKVYKDGDYWYWGRAYSGLISSDDYAEYFNFGYRSCLISDIKKYCLNTVKKYLDSGGTTNTSPAPEPKSPVTKKHRGLYRFNWITPSMPDDEWFLNVSTGKTSKYTAKVYLCGNKWNWEYWKPVSNYIFLNGTPKEPVIRSSDSLAKTKKMCINHVKDQLKVQNTRKVIKPSM